MHSFAEGLVKGSLCSIAERNSRPEMETGEELIALDMSMCVIYSTNVGRCSVSNGEQLFKIINITIPVLQMSTFSSYSV